MNRIRCRLGNLIISLLLLNILGSCIEFDNKGYPQKIVFSYEGGEEQFNGYEPFMDFSIDSHLSEVEDGYMMLTHEWLTVKQKLGDTKLILIAQPMTSGKSRELWIRGNFGREVCDIVVKQKGK